MTQDVVIAGGGLGAVRTAQALRDLGHDGGLTLLSAEDVLPYDRPPLSKGYLLGKVSADGLTLVPAARLEELGITVRLGVRAHGLDLAARRIRLMDGDEVAYDKLVVATGARPNRLPMFEGMDGVVHLRDLPDARGLKAELGAHPRIGVVGGGFIGLEIASMAREIGCAVTVVEAAPAPLAPILGAELGGWVRDWHEEQGVAFRCGATVTAVHGRGRPESLVLGDGEHLDVDVVVVGVGITPDAGWLGEAGLEVHRGLVCDATGHTSDPDVFGVGDVTCRHVDGVCSPSRHWTAAGDQARAAAAALLGREASTGGAQEGYFWSDQFDRRLQFTGRVPGEPQVRITSGSVGERKFVALLEDAGAPTGVFAMASPRDFVRASIALRRNRLTAGGATG